MYFFCTFYIFFIFSGRFSDGMGLAGWPIPIPSESLPEKYEKCVKCAKKHIIAVKINDDIFFCTFYTFSGPAKMCKMCKKIYNHWFLQQLYIFLHILHLFHLFWRIFWWDRAQLAPFPSETPPEKMKKMQNVQKNI